MKVKLASIGRRKKNIAETHWMAFMKFPKEDVDALRRREEKRIECDFACRENEGDTQ